MRPVSKKKVSKGKMPKEQIPLTFAPLRWLSLSTICSLLADNIYLIALPWLAYKVSGSSTTLVTVLTIAAISRAIFTIFAGTLSDRFNPKVVMIVSIALSSVMTLALTLMAWEAVLQIWHLYLWSIIFGLIDAVFYPASSTLLPRLFDSSQLAKVNSVQGVARQLSSFVGPALGGLLVGFNPLFALLVSSILSILSVMSLLPLSIGVGRLSNPSISFKDSLMGLHFIWSQPSTRSLMLLLAGLNLALMGTYLIGGRLLANERFGGASSFGFILSAFAGGGLLGTLLAGFIPVKRRGWLMLGVAAVLGVGTMFVGFSNNLVLTIMLYALMGFAEGFEEVQMATWFQTTTPLHLQGRVHSVLELAGSSLEPVSYALASWLGVINPRRLFVLAGVATLLITSFTTPALKKLE